MKEKVSPLQRALNVWAIVLILWSIYRYFFKTDLPIAIDEFVAKPLIFLLPIYYYVVHYEKKNFFAAVDLKKKHALQEIAIAAVVGVIFFMTGSVAHWIKMGSFLPSPEKLVSASAVLMFVAVSFASSFSEEILSRGFILQRLYKDSHNTFTSIFFGSLLFFFLHIPILFTMESVTGMALVQVMITDFILSVVVSIMYLQQRNVLLPILIHALYNLSIYLFLS